MAEDEASASTPLLAGGGGDAGDAAEDVDELARQAVAITLDSARLAEEADDEEGKRGDDKVPSGLGSVVSGHKVAKKFGQLWRQKSRTFKQRTSPPYLVYTNFSLLDLRLKRNGEGADVDFIIMLTFQDERLVEKLRKFDADAAKEIDLEVGREEFFPSDFQLQFINADHITCIHGRTRSAFYVHTDEETGESWVQNTRRYMGTVHVNFRYKDFPFDLQEVRIGVTSFTHKLGGGMLVFRYAPGLLDLERNPWTFNARDGSPLRDGQHWVGDSGIDGYYRLPVKLKGRDTNWRVVEDECLATDRFFETFWSRHAFRELEAARQATVAQAHGGPGGPRGAGTAVKQDRLRKQAASNAAKPLEQEHYSRFDVLVTLERNSTFFVFKVNTIIMLITLMSFTVFGLTAPSLAGSRLVILTVAFLSLVTFHNKSDTEVPNVSTVTMLDLFIYSAYFFVISTMVASVTVSVLQQEYKDDEASLKRLAEVDHVLIWAFPLSFVGIQIFLLLYACCRKVMGRRSRRRRRVKEARRWEDTIGTYAPTAASRLTIAASSAPFGTHTPVGGSPAASPAASVPNTARRNDDGESY